MKTETELYQTAVRLLDEAAQWITKGKIKKAESLLVNMDEDVYELCLDIYEQNDKNVDYFCCRFTFGSLEFDSEQRPSDEQINEYWGHWFFWKGYDPHPRWVTIHSIRYDITQTELPLEVERKKPEPKPVVASKPLKQETKQQAPSAFQLGLFGMLPTSVRAFA